jgi:hypothetical protein
VGAQMRRRLLLGNAARSFVWVTSISPLWGSTKVSETVNSACARLSVQL